MVGFFLAPRWPIMVPFCGMDHQKSIVLLISDTISVGGCWGQPMQLFWKLVDETQMGTPCNHAARDISSKFSIFLLPRAIYFRSYHYETPCKCILFAIWRQSTDLYMNLSSSWNLTSPCPSDDKLYAQPSFWKWPHQRQLYSDGQLETNPVQSSILVHFQI